MITVLADIQLNFSTKRLVGLWLRTNCEPLHYQMTQAMNVLKESKWVRVEPEANNAGVIYRSYDCAKCKRKIHQLEEAVWQSRGKFYHEICKTLLRLTKKETK